MCCFFIFILLLTAQLSSTADQSDSYFVQHYDNRNGLSNSSINNIYRDADNILWIATWDGLNMYDGTSFHVFNCNKQDDNKSIGSNVIQSITEDKSGDIWIATIGGISRFEKYSGKFYNYSYDHDKRSRISELMMRFISGPITCLPIIVMYPDCYRNAQSCTCAVAFSTNDIPV